MATLDVYNSPRTPTLSPRAAVNPKAPLLPSSPQPQYKEIPLGVETQGVKSLQEIYDELSRVNELPSAQIAALGALLIVHQRYDDAARVLNNLLDQIIHGVKQGDGSFGDVFYNLGIAQSSLGNHSDAVTYFASACRSYLNKQDEQGYLLATVNQASSLLILEQDELVVGLLSEYLYRFETNRIPTESINRHQLILCYASLAGASRNLGRVEEAVEYLVSGQVIVETTGDSADDPVVLGLYQNLGAAYNELGEFSKAVPFHERALQLAKLASDTVAQGLILLNLGFACAQLKLFTKAHECFEIALRLYIGLGLRKEEAETRERLGTMQFCMGNIQEASYQYQLALNIANEYGYDTLQDIATEKINGVMSIIQQQKAQHEAAIQEEHRTVQEHQEMLERAQEQQEEAEELQLLQDRQAYMNNAAGTQQEYEDQDDEDDEARYSEDDDVVPVQRNAVSLPVKRARVVSVRRSTVPTQQASRSCILQ